VKKILGCALALFCSLSLGATLTPIQLLNPAGSTAGQVISSTGATTPPIWSGVTLSAVTGTLPIANGGTGSTSASAARTALGLGTAATVNTGTSGATIPLLNGANTWAAAQTFSVRPTFNGATPYDTGNLTIANYAPLASPAFTGTATFSTRPSFNSATPWDSANLASPAATTGNLSQFASTTSAQLATLLSDETGSGSAVFSLTPTITAPNIVGTISGGNAAAGSVGEYVTATQGTPVSMTSSTSANIISISLTAGDWDVSGVFRANPAGTTVIQIQGGSISTTSATFGALGTATILNSTNPAGNGSTAVTPTVRISVSSTTTVYLVGVIYFTTSTATMDGMIRARRVR
jgi:hypothetical protein